MSTTVDNRVVQIEFDNRKFESNVHTTLSTLDRLKEKLKFSNASDGLESIAKAAEKVDLSKFESAVENVKVSFSALEVVALSVLSNIVNKAVDAGTKFVKSLTIDQVTEGFSKYERKVTAVQTILAATKHDYEGFTDAERLAIVEEQLEKMMWFTDETSYNFSDMTDNVGKFTSAGVKLEDAVEAMQGIATWAAISGQNAQAASRVMYNFSQAMGANKMTIRDWMSVENANMATMEFKELALAIGAADETNKLIKKAADGTYTAKIKSGQKLSDLEGVTAKNFRDSLSGGWFDNKTMVKVLKVYGSFSGELKNFTEEFNISTNAALNMIKSYKEGTLDLSNAVDGSKYSLDSLKEQLDRFSSEEYDIGVSAFKAAQETKKLSEAIEYTKDAVSSQWLKTFQLILGNYEEAKALWSTLTDKLYHVFVESGEERNAILQDWHDSGGYQDLVDSFWNVVDAVTAVIDTIKEAFHNVFGYLDSDILLNWTKKLKAFTEKLKMGDETTENFRNTLQGIFTILKFGLNIVKAVFAFVSPIAKLIFKIASGLLGVTGAMGKGLSSFGEWIENTEKFKDAGEKVAAFLEKIPAKAEEIFKSVTGLTFAEAFEKISDKLSVVFEKLKDAFELAKKYIIPILQAIPGKLNEAFEKLTGMSFGDAFGKFKETGKSIVDGFVAGFKEKWDWVKSQKDKIFGVVEKVIDWIKDFFGIHSPSKKMIPVGRNVVEGFVKGFNDESDGIGSRVFAFGKKFIEVIKKVASKIKDAFGLVIDAVRNFFAGLKHDSDDSTVGEVLSEEVPKKVGGFVDALKKLVDKIKPVASAIGSKIHDIVHNGIMMLVGAVNALDGKNLIKIAKAVKKFVKSIIIAIRGVSFSKFLLDLGSFFKGIGKVFKQTAKTLKTTNKILKQRFGKSKSSAFKDVAEAIFIIALALLVVVEAIKLAGNLKTDELWQGVTVMGGALLAIFLFLKLLNTNKMPQTGQLFGMAFVILSISLSLIIIIKAIKSMVDLCENHDADRIKQAMVYLVVIFGAIALLVKLLITKVNVGDKVGVKSSGFGALVGMAILLLVLGSVMKKIVAAIEVLVRLAEDTSERDVKEARDTLLSVISAVMVLVRVMTTEVTAGKVGVKNSSAKQIAAMAALLWVIGNVFMKISGAIAVLVGLSKTSGGKEAIGHATGTLAAMLTLMMVLARVITTEVKAGKVNVKNSSAKQIAAMAALFLVLGRVMIKIATAVSIISGASRLAGPEAVNQAAIIIGAIFTIMAIAVVLISKNFSNGSMKTSNVSAKQLFAMALIFAALAAVCVAIGYAIKLILSAGSLDQVRAAGVLLAVMLAIIGAIVVLLSKNVKDVKTTSTKQLWAMALIFAALAAVCVAIGYAMKLILSAGSIGQVIAAGVLLAVMLAIIGATVILVTKNAKGAKTVGEKQLWPLIVLFGVLALVCVAIGYAMKSIMSVGSTGDIVAAGLMLTLILAVIGGITLLLTSKLKDTGTGAVTGILALAAVFAVVTLFVRALAWAISALMSLGDPDTVIKMMGMLTLILVAVAGITFLMSKIPAAGAIGGVAAFAVALIAIAAAIMLVALALKKIVESFAEMEQVGPGGAESFAESLKRMMSIIPTFFRELGNGVIELLNVFVEQAPQIEQAITTLIDTALNAFNKRAGKIISTLTKVGVKVLNAIKILGPLLIDVVLTLLDNLLTGLHEHMPSYAESVIGMIEDFLVEFEANAEDIFNLMFDIVFDFIEGLIDSITEKGPEISDKLVVMVISIINGVATAITSHISELQDAVSHLADALVGAINSLFGTAEEAAEDSAKDSKKSPFEKIAAGVIRAFIRGVVGMASEVANGIITLINEIKTSIEGKGTEFKEAIQGLLGQIIKEVKDFFGIKESDSKDKNKFWEIGKKLLGGIFDGISAAWNTVKGFTSKIWEPFQDVIDKIKSFFVGDGKDIRTGKIYQIGKDIVEGFFTGLAAKYDEIKSKSGFLSWLANLIATVKDKLDSNSPSKVFMRIGSDTIEGFAIGIENSEGSVIKNMSSFGDSIIGTFANALDYARDLADDDFNNTITITPVLDLDRFSQDASLLNRQLAGARTMDLGATLSYAEQAAYAVSRNNFRNESDPAYDKLTSLLQRLVENPPSVNNNEFNITGNDPEAIADEVSAALQKDMIRRNAVWA